MAAASARSHHSLLLRVAKLAAHKVNETVCEPLGGFLIVLLVCSAIVPLVLLATLHAHHHRDESRLQVDVSATDAGAAADEAHAAEQHGNAASSSNGLRHMMLLNLDDDEGDHEAAAAAAGRAHHRPDAMIIKPAVSAPASRNTLRRVQQWQQPRHQHQHHQHQQQSKIEDSDDDEDEQSDGTNAISTEGAAQQQRHPMLIVTPASGQQQQHQASSLLPCLSSPDLARPIAGGSTNRRPASHFRFPQQQHLIGRMKRLIYDDE